MALAADPPNAVDVNNRLALSLGRLNADTGYKRNLSGYVSQQFPNVIKRRLSGWFRVKRY